MIHEISKNKISDKWNYHVKYIYHYKLVKSNKSNKRTQEVWESIKAQDCITSIELFLKTRSEGEWIRLGNNFYFMNLGDAFNIRLYFAEGISVIRQSS